MFCLCYFLVFKCHPSYLTASGRTATRIVALTLSMKKISIAKNLVNFGPVTPDILWLICMGGAAGRHCAV